MKGVTTTFDFKSEAQRRHFRGLLVVMDVPLRDAVGELVQLFIDDPAIRLTVAKRLGKGERAAIEDANNAALKGLKTFNKAIKKSKGAKA